MSLLTSTWTKGTATFLLAKSSSRTFSRVPCSSVIGSPRSWSKLRVERCATTELRTDGVDPVWSADGRQIAFAVPVGAERGVHVMPAFGGSTRRIYQGEDAIYLDDWSRDGAWLAGHVRVNGPGILIPTSGGSQPILLEERTSGAGVDEATFSPDGQWLAYGLNRAGSVEVFLTAVPPTGERWQVSTSGGAQPRWRADGRALYFLSLSGQMMIVDVTAKPGAPPAISAPRELFATGLQVTPGVDQYRVSKDGTRFLFRRPDEAAAASLNHLNVIVNWPALLARR